MKKIVYLLLVLFIISCQKEDGLQMKEVIDSLKVDKKQIIEFELVNDTVLVGREGTKIFVQKNMFKNYNGGLVALELTEYFKIEEIILNSIETVTNDNQLLETSGVLYVNFKENGEQLVLKDNAKYRIEVPKNIKKKSAIYYNNNDSVFKWELSDDKIYTDIPDRFKNYRYGLTVEKDGVGGYFKTVHIDSLANEWIKDSLYIEVLKVGSRNQIDYLLHEDVLVYEGNLDTLIKQLKASRNNEELIYEFNASRLGYINIDRILEFEKLELISIIESTKSYKDLHIYYIYKDNDSFYQEYWENTTTDFKREVKIQGKIKVIVFATKNSKIYSDSFYVDSKSKTTFTVDLKETTVEKLKKEMIN